MTDTDQFTKIEYGKQEADVVRPADIAVADHVAPSESDVDVTSQDGASASADSETATNEASAGTEKAPDDSASHQASELHLNLELEGNAFLEELQGLLAKHEQDITIRVDDLVAEKLEPILKEMQDLRDLLNAAPVGVTDAGATHDFSPYDPFWTGGLSTNPDPVEVLAERVARLERRFRHS